MNAATPDQLLSKSFAWFTGVIEDINDPMQMGRVRVRCFGYHTGDKSEIQTKDLPWAFIVQPATSAAMGGIGTSSTGVLPGSWVVGFFRDGPSAQDPLILGTIASMPSAPDKERGFSDPSGIYPKAESLQYPDIPKQSTSNFDKATSYATRNKFRAQNVEIAVPPKVSTVAVDEADSYYTRKTWSNLDVKSVVAPVYPNNHTQETKSGHVLEIDDTTGFERIAEMHTTGTYREIDAKGNLTTTVVGDRYTVILASDNIYIKGSCNITIDGNLHQLVKGDYHLEVEGNKTEYIKKSRQSKVGQSEQVEISKELAINVASNRIERIGGNSVLTVDGNIADTIAGNSDLTVIGNSGFVIVGNHQEFSGGNHETTSSGHLYLTSKENLEFESQAAMKITVDGTQDISASVTNIANNVNVTGTIDATVEVEAGSNNIKLTTHRHSGVQAGLSNTLGPIP